jgi:hypothetical protein
MEVINKRSWMSQRENIMRKCPIRDHGMALMQIVLFYDSSWSIIIQPAYAATDMYIIFIKTAFQHSFTKCSICDHLMSRPRPLNVPSATIHSVQLHNRETIKIIPFCVPWDSKRGFNMSCLLIWPFTHKHNWSTFLGRGRDMTMY